MSPVVVVVTLNIEYTLWHILNVLCTCVPLYEVFQRDRHLLLYGAGVVNMAGDVKELCAGVSLSAKAQKPRASTTTDGGRHRYSLHIGNGCRATKHTLKIEDKSEVDFSELPLFAQEEEEEASSSIPK